jgi:hypothetical protein
LILNNNNVLQITLKRLQSIQQQPQ